MKRLIPSAALIMLCACADSEPASLVAPDEEQGYNMVEPVKTPIAADTELTVGEWTSSLQEEQPALQFGAPNTEPLFSLRCDDSEGLLLNRHGTIATGGLEMMSITVGDATSQFAVRGTQGPLPMLRATIPPEGDLLTQLASAQQPIRVSVGDGPPVVMPPSPLIGEFIQSCSRDEQASATDAAAAVENGQAATENEQASR